ncbi:MAG: oligopeptidase B, partial [Gammaproteobacteria bacterium]|nr:oligopeptidase B [Gammaproteobacteria bacterium]NIW49906.1 oligopeptidase B [Gammaproteobacteria bacterium]NIW98122.1 oligopeptidase B [Phycisphaerae bacterium]
SIHNHTRIDNYYWLREKTNPEVIAYLEAENQYTEAMMKHTEGLQERLYNEMVGRIQESDRSAPVRDGEYLYYSRTEANKQYSIYC